MVSEQLNRGDVSSHTLRKEQSVLRTDGRVVFAIDIGIVLDSGHRGYLTRSGHDWTN